MAPTRVSIKAALAAALLLAAALAPASAATFSARRGVNMDAWTTWPAEARWGEADVLFPFPEWRRTVGEDDLARLKNAGFDFVRMPVDPAPFLARSSEGLRDRLLAEVLAAVRFLDAGGLKVVVDFHLMPTGPGRSVGMAQVIDDAREFDAYLALVGRMAKSLSALDPEKVAFEPMNEPVVDCQADGTNFWPDRERRLWQAARGAAPKLTLVLTGACYSMAESLAKMDPAAFPDDNLIWTFHSYAPFILTHQGATWAGDFIPHVTGLPFPLSAVPRAELDEKLDAIRGRIKAQAPLLRRRALLRELDKEIGAIDTPEKLDAAMEEPFTTVAKWAERHGVKPQDILLGEFGMIRREYGSDSAVPAQYRAAYVDAMAGHAEAHGFAWSVWSYGGAFGIVDGFDGEKAGPELLEAIRGLR